MSAAAPTGGGGADPCGGGAGPTAVSEAGSVGGGSADSLSQPNKLTIWGVEVDVIGAGVGRNNHTSGLWKYLVEFTPAVSGKNVNGCLLLVACYLVCLCKTDDTVRVF